MKNNNEYEKFSTVLKALILAAAFAYTSPILIETLASSSTIEKTFCKGIGASIDLKNMRKNNDFMRISLIDTSNHSRVSIDKDSLKLHESEYDAHTLKIKLKTFHQSQYITLNFTSSEAFCKKHNSKRDKNE